MKNFRTLMFLDRFQSIFEKFGIDYPVMRSILHIKLTMDQRRVPTVIAGHSKEKEGNQFLKSLWMYALIGLVLLPFVLIGEEYIFQMSLFFGIAMFIIMTSMISDFSAVLLDIRDKPILNTKPVNKRTVNAAKILHISIYMFLLTGALAAASLVFGVINRGVGFTLLVLVELFLVNLLIVVFTALFYLIVLKFFDGERLKDMINYVQIGLSVGLFIGYQIVVRSFEFMDLDIIFSPEWWHYFIPPIWFAAPFEVILNGNTDPTMLIFSALALLGPILSIILYIKLVPTFEENLEKLSNHGTRKEKAERKISRCVSQFLCTNREERAFYRFATLMMKNEREFKLKVYPSLGFSIVIPFVLSFNFLRDSTWAEIGVSNMYLTIYFTTLMIPSVISMLIYSGKYKGAWVYSTMPIVSHGSVLKGTMKAFLVKLYLPIFILLSVIFIAISSFRVLPDLFVVFVTTCIYTVICYKGFHNKKLPFTESFEMAHQGDGWKIFVFFLPVAGFAALHFIALSIPYGIYIYLVILLLVNAIIWRRLY
ncbi:hypothetical protein [Alteribacter populi]|uniref:hypothetical protein n=1 Tax=Alteribacter populi TaxID=2011011 RepID=UPI000BBB1372|nr:hypothetical protein [Alteribacter populi]